MLRSAMTSIFTVKNEFRIRKKILRGVYEENLFILGKGRPALSLRRRFPLKKVLLFTVVCVFTVLMHGQYMDSSFAPAESTLNINTQPLPLPELGVSSALIPDMSKDALGPPASVPLEDTANTTELSAFVKSQNVPLGRMIGLKIKTIMIDAGHGGTALGCVGEMGTKEKDITLEIAKRLRTQLEESGRYHVLMTREDDSTVPLPERVALVQKAKADLFISIHLNDLPQKNANVIETYYFGPSSDKKTLRLAEQENAGSEYGLSDFKEVVEKLGKTMKLQESKELAESIQANLFLNGKKHSKDMQDYGVKRAPFVVLLGVDVPCVLAEVSCLSNRGEERELHSESHRENIARYLAAGIFDYLNKGDLTYESKR